MPGHIEQAFDYLYTITQDDQDAVSSLERISGYITALKEQHDNKLTRD